jgi:PleD family two-component response regulator
MELHHGTLDCLSQGVDEGCLFVLQLPAFQRKSPLMSANDQPRVPPKLDLTSTPSLPLVSRALVVDDSALCRKFVVRILKDAQIESIEACDGVECVRIMEDRKDEVDVIILDYEVYITLYTITYM